MGGRRKQPQEPVITSSIQTRSSQRLQKLKELDAKPGASKVEQKKVTNEKIKQVKSKKSEQSNDVMNEKSSRPSNKSKSKPQVKDDIKIESKKEEKADEDDKKSKAPKVQQSKAESELLGKRNTKQSSIDLLQDDDDDLIQMLANKTTSDKKRTPVNEIAPALSRTNKEEVSNTHQKAYAANNKIIDEIKVNTVQPIQVDVLSKSVVDDNNNEDDFEMLL